MDLSFIERFKVVMNLGRTKALTGLLIGSKDIPYPLYVVASKNWKFVGAPYF